MIMGSFIHLYKKSYPFETKNQHNPLQILQFVRLETNSLLLNI